jgi:hypothetical protein
MEAVDDQLNALSRRVHFIVKDHSALGKCTSGDTEIGQQGCRSTISIQQALYNSTIRSGGHQASGERASQLFTIAATLLHEMAHATSNHIMGSRPDDFFEDALVNEGGFDYVSRIFGMVPRPLTRKWVQWQNLTFLKQTSYPVTGKCRDAKKLSTIRLRYPWDAEFAERLLNDEWWEGAVEDRSADIVPDFLRKKEIADLLATAPASFRRWLERVTSGVRIIPRYQHEATKVCYFPLSIRQPTPLSSFSSTATALEFDIPSEFDGHDLSFEPIPLPRSADDIRRVIPVHGGITPERLWKLFIIQPFAFEELRFIDLVNEVCQFDEVKGTLVLKWRLDEELDMELDEEMNEALEEMLDEELDEMLDGVSSEVLDWALDGGSPVDKMEVC